MVRFILLKEIIGYPLIHDSPFDAQSPRGILDGHVEPKRQAHRKVLGLISARRDAYDSILTSDPPNHI